MASDDGRMDALERNTEGGCGQKCDREHAHFLAQSFAEARMMCKSAVPHEIVINERSRSRRAAAPAKKQAQALSPRLETRSVKRHGRSPRLCDGGIISRSHACGWLCVSCAANQGVGVKRPCPHSVGDGCGAWRDHSSFRLTYRTRNRRQKTSRNSCRLCRSCSSDLPLFLVPTSARAHSGREVTPRAPCRGRRARPALPALPGCRRV